jgi:hypothetical protein
MPSLSISLMRAALTETGFLSWRRAGGSSGVPLTGQGRPARAMRMHIDGLAPPAAITIRDAL